MIVAKIIVNNECRDATKVALFGTLEESMDQDPYIKMVDFKTLNVDSKHFYTARDAKKVMNDYAVTQLPFVLLIDDTLPEGEQEYAAVYSEEGPITIKRINAKL